jgi:subtilisin family serine protease
MFRTRRTRRSSRALYQPGCEGLEVRNLLSSTPNLASLVPQPAGLTSASPAADGYDALIQASATRAAYNVTGRGLSAAVIDEGVNYNNAALGGGLGAGFKVKDGADLADNDPDPLAASSQHGTAVAGIIASSDPTYPGVAPDANIVALKVFDNAGNGSFSAIAHALQWVVDHHTQDNISVVNLSISDGNNYAIDMFSQDDSIGQTIAGLVKQLDALHIPVVTATGNSFTGHPGMGFIAIESGTISVTSTDGDQFASNAQRLPSSAFDPGTSLAAPGVNVTGPTDGNNFANMSGTSFSTAEVTGSIILLQQIYESRFGALPAVSDVLGWLKAGAKPINDPVTGATIGRIDILQAASHIPGAAPATPTPTPTPVTPPPVTPPPIDAAPPAANSGGSSHSSNSSSPPANSNPSTAPSTPSQQPSSHGSAGGQSTPTTTPVSPPLIDLLINGQSAGQFAPSSPSDPFVAYEGLFGVKVAFQRVQVWSSSPASPGAAAASGSIGQPLALSANANTSDDAVVGSGGTVRITTRQGANFQAGLLAHAASAHHSKAHPGSRKLATGRRRG